MSELKEPADELNDVNHDADRPNEISNKKLEDKSPANIYLINKGLNPMFGVPMKKSSFERSLMKVSEADKTASDEITEGKILNDEKKKTTKKKGTVRAQPGLMKRGYDFVKEGLKKSRKK